MIFLFILMIVDTIFGWIKSFKLSKWKSCTAKWGVIGKICEVILIYVVYYIDIHLHLNGLYKIVLYYFYAVEVGSIIENYCEINNNIPPSFIKIINNIKVNLAKRIEQFFENKKKGE